MDTKPNVVVGPPDDDGLRKVVIDGKSKGKVWSHHELQKVLRRAGVDPKTDIEWRGGNCTVWPAHSWGRRMTGAVMAAGFLATAAMCAWIGVKDSLDALTFAGRVTGFVFLFMAAVELVAFAAGFDYWRKRKMRYSGPALLFGALIELFVALVLILMYFANRGRPAYALCLVLWAGLMVCASWSLWMLYRRRVWKALRYPGRIAIGAIVSTVLVVTNLAYTQIYLPSISRTLVQGTADIGRPSLNKDGTKMFLPVRLHLKNSGEVPVHILGSIYWIHLKLASDPKDRVKLLKPGELVKPPGEELSPGEEIAADVVAEIAKPADANYEAVTAQVEAYAFRQDRMKLDVKYERSGRWRGKLEKEGKGDDPPSPIKDRKEYFRYQAPISQSSELLNLTRGRERVTVWWLYRPLPAVYVHVASPDDKKVLDLKDPTQQRQAIDRYGLAFVRGSLAQTPYPQLLREAQVRRPK
ncbi:MFS transporter [Streptomyces yangpuensis]|uniref:MFS transporter n=1 Tax=Streptomyces yangpuensis TaxID=1648182 RepID=A0ABY5PTK4_9ACTN|nr:MFS transporter [Streptomyces yangpuensis]UUY47359.1 MFS transporter [Streptomyces yangpuensis]